MTTEVRLRNKWLSALLPALMVLALGACSSSDEAEDTGGGGSSDCQSECSAVPDHKTDECMIACEA
jgi:hypothetical protein